MTKPRAERDRIPFNTFGCKIGPKTYDFRAGPACAGMRDPGRLDTAQRPLRRMAGGKQKRLKDLRAPIAPQP